MSEHTEVLLDPSIIYSPTVLAAADGGLLKAAAHITGGGIAENLARALPSGMGVTIDRSFWDPPPVFDLIRERGVADRSMWETFNMGIGFCLIADPSNRESIMETVSVHDPLVLGTVEQSDGVTLL